MRAYKALGYAAILGLLAGCRSSGIAFNPPPGGSVVTLVIAGSASIAYAIGTQGTWKQLPVGQTQFTVTSGTAYGVAYTCAAEEVGVSTDTSSTEVVVFQGTTTEIDVVPVQCGAPPEATLAGTYDASAFENATRVSVDDFSYTPATGNYSATVPPGTQDVFAEAYDASDNVLAVKTYPSVNVASTGTTTQNVVIASADAVGGPQTFAMTNVPASASSEVAVVFGTVAGTTINLVSSTGTSVEYPTVAAADVASDDAYVAEGFASMSGPGTAKSVVSAVFSTTPPTSAAFSVPFNVSDPATTSNPTFTLSYTGYGGLTGGIAAYALFENWPGGSAVAFVSSGFLKQTGSQSYTVPTIPVAGFPSVTAPSGSRFAWEAEAIYGPAALFSELGPAFLDDTARSPHAQSHLQSLLQGSSRTSEASSVRSESSTSEPLTSGIIRAALASDCYIVGGSVGCEL
ncbi:MAG: hypothetical protein ACREMP_08715 [Candidatus Tyrphobacter sp.]